MLININTDNLFIAKRLKQIDSNYFIVFNTKSQKYEVHHKGQTDNTFCLSLPFCELDSRTLELVQKTRIENINKLIEEIDKENQRKETQKNKEILSLAKEILKWQLKKY